MTLAKKTLLTLVMLCVVATALPTEAKADGPLRRWLRGLWKPCNTCNTQPQQTFAPASFSPAQTTAAVAPNAYGLQPGQCMKTCQQTCSRTVVNYVPYTAYRTNWNRVPVTQYRPVTNSDPVTGCTVTCMKPCTTYTYQMQRVPYTTYRPVYRQETYKVPVTTITNDCATGNCGTSACSTGLCGTGTNMVAPQSFSPLQPTMAAPMGATDPFAGGVPANTAPSLNSAGYTPVTSGYLPAAPQATTTRSYETPNGTIVPSGTYDSMSQPATQYRSTMPADIAPVLDQMVDPRGAQRATPNRNRISDRTNADWYEQPAQISVSERAAASPVRKQFAYSPVRFASHRDETVRSDRGYENWSEQDTNRQNGWEEVN